MMSEPKLDSPLSISWHDSAWIPMLNAGNVLDYFSERSNPFYDRTCNNEVIKMQRLNPEQHESGSMEADFAYNAEGYSEGRVQGPRSIWVKTIQKCLGGLFWML
ncbi:Mediator of RNA polymerase II transcription subunit 6 [Caligus rogercresseyi]|uniref:Mediator of RNA polymerase II transcription subunit 6 n=1 Tax=Caligus rogercresseyi TaxID=217165 RepID=A0A7T8HMA2_CALRO|nr:Mediator of RNA polymerase II transcription subunit 6 [Caligus rogercresseyi]